MLLLVLFELGNDASFQLAYRSSAGQRVFRDRIQGDADVAQFLRQQKGPFRIEFHNDDIPPNWAIYHNLDTFHTYSGITANTWSMEVDQPNTRMLLNTRYTLGTAPTEPGARDVFTGASGVKVFENPEAFPRAWAVGTATVLSKQDGARMIGEHLGDLRNTAFTKNAPPSLPPCAGPAGSVDVERYGASQVTLRAQMICEGMVVLSDSFYPGWRADVDGKPAQIYEVDLSLRGVRVPKGSHRIQYRYRPLSVYIGAALTFVGVALAFGISRWERQRSEPLMISARESASLEV